MKNLDTLTSLARALVVVSALLTLGSTSGCRTVLERIIVITDGGAGDAPPAEGMGSRCSKDSDCPSKHCEQGVCCSTECKGPCRACNLPEKVGTCTPLPNRAAPVGDGCAKEPVATCGRDGTCDGAGSCRKYPDGETCQPGSCDPSATSSMKTCRGGSCVEAECGKKLGDRCSNASECRSGFCADGVCCDSECSGACVSCNQPEKMGECRSVAEGKMDTHGKCQRSDVKSCGLSGYCNGLGGCAKYAAGTTCMPGSCSGGSMVPESICNGVGECVQGSPISCFPYVCADNACKGNCSSNSDCVPSNTCVKPGPSGSCGKKGLGQKCVIPSDCKSNFCVDGVCCDQACTGKCSSCNQANALGRCTAVPAGLPDPHNQCQDKGPASCGTNGKCNGARDCQTYPIGTVCRQGSCSTVDNRVTEDAICLNGSCSALPSRTCAPYRCSNERRCGSFCTVNSDCAAGKVCVNRSCGLRPVGAVCTQASDCEMGMCAQGVCCAMPCTASCFSCSLTGSLGTCSPVPASGPDPAGVCTDAGRDTCRNDGTCDGRGGCKKYASGTVCRPARCALGTATSESTCDGAGMCSNGSTRSCSPFTCNTAGTACFDSCRDDTQCIPNLHCNMGQCGRKDNGAACVDKDECTSGHCVDGFCCDTGCTGVCLSCALPGMRGKCSPIADDVPDDDGGCVAQAEMTCGNDGKCNGKGACRKWGAGVQCRAASCPPTGAVLKKAASCDGQGNCPASTTENCGNYKCDTNDTCRMSCMSDADCNGKACDLPAGGGPGTCGKSLLGAQCSSDTHCGSGHCVDKTCCSTASCGTCQTCANMSGQCANVPSGSSDPDSCSSSTDPCGTTGKCDGSGACKLADTNTPCGMMCAGTGQVVTKTCDGSGMCTGMGTPRSCGGFVCQSNACVGTCDPNDNSGCVPGKVCIGGNNCTDPPPPPPPDGGP